MSTDHSNNQKVKSSFEERIAFMEAHIDAFRWESCAKIIVYLKVFGPMEASALKEKLQLKGEKSLYRSINKLRKIGFIEKIPSKNDKRIVIYKALPTIIEDPEFDKDFIEYLQSNNRLSLISEYLGIANQSSFSFLKAVTEIIQKTQEQDSMYFQQRFLNPSIFFETIFSLKEADILKEKIYTFLQKEIIPIIKKTKYDGNSPITHPAAFYLSFMPI